MATSIQDSPISKLSAVETLSADDLLLVSKKADTNKYTSNGITFEDTVSSVIAFASGPLSSYFQQSISSFTGSVTLMDWTRPDETVI